VDRCVVDYVDRVAGEPADGASRDQLTGLLDRRAFCTQLSLEAARARRYRGSVALVLFDLDRSEEGDRDRLRPPDAGAFVARLRRELPDGLSVSAGAACFPD
jgi:Diguanylate cyclase, GGDEF domain